MSSVCTGSIQGGFSKGACLLWLSFLNSNTSYFEWGSGFTTTVADMIVQTGTSIEGSKSWFDRMQTKPLKRMHLKYVDIGHTRAFSWPSNSSKGAAYINSIHGLHTAVNVALVDGRWRVACAMAAHSKLDEAGVVLVHDFDRKEYQVMLKVFDKVTLVDSLAVLRRKPDSGRMAAELKRAYASRPHR